MDIMERFKILMAMDAEFLPNEYGGDIFHYTSASGFQSILFGDRYDVILWASRYDCLNDASEGTVAEEVLREVSAEMYREKEISEEMYRVFVGVHTAHTIPLFREVEGDIKATRQECDRFICSFSKNCDSLAMWNYYSKGSKYEGYNIGFNSKLLKMTIERSFTGIEAQVHIYPVVYDRSVQKAFIKRSLVKLAEFYSKENEPRIRAILSTRLIDWGLVFKMECFAHEEEVRIIVDLAKRERQIPVHYRMNAGYVIPYIKLKLEQDDVTGVTLGPLLGGESQSKQQVTIMQEMLQANGFPLAQVGYSHIPVRY